MRMRLLAAGTRMPGWIDAGFADYAGRLRGDYRLELTEIPLGERGGGDVRRAVEAEGRRMLAAAGERGHLVALQVGGRALTTEQLARWKRKVETGKP
jgi:23S rRNA (pseudouridine1915-N3)-methyltransferase